MHICMPRHTRSAASATACSPHHTRLLSFVRLQMSADATADGLSVAESGGSRVRGSQVAAEEQRDVQFMTRTAVA